jgi:lysophospholipase L1-like esterase
MLIVWLIIAVLVAATMGLIGLEVWARQLIRRLRSDFQWLITEQDEAPELDSRGLTKFVAIGYDPELGWVRKPNTSGVARGAGSARWSTDQIGARRDPNMDGWPVKVVAMGDSYTFSFEVEDSDAWPARLGQLLGNRVANFGVGNYGLDQAVLRYQREGRIPGAKVAILGVVPETMARIFSAWKHYWEYGNVFAFKPRFHLADGQLELVPNVIETPEDYPRYRKFLPLLHKRDYFYREKFRRDMIRPPYLWHWLSKPRNRHLVRLLRERQRRRANGTCDKAFEDAPFRGVVERNLRMAGQMYSKPECRRLFKEILLLFAAEARTAGAQPVFVMLPQFLDLECFGADQPYRPMLDELSEHLLVIDAAPALLGPTDVQLHVEDTYGGHYSAQGNEVIAKLVAQHVAPLLQGAYADSKAGEARA